MLSDIIEYKGLLHMKQCCGKKRYRKAKGFLLLYIYFATAPLFIDIIIILREQSKLDLHYSETL